MRLNVSGLAATLVAAPLACVLLAACGSGVSPTPDSLYPSGAGNSAEGVPVDNPVTPGEAGEAGDSSSEEDGAAQTLPPVVLPDGRQADRSVDKFGSLGEMDKFSSPYISFAEYLRVQESVAEPFERLSGITMSAEQRAAWLYVISVLSLARGGGDFVAPMPGFSTDGVDSVKKAADLGPVKWGKVKDGKASAAEALILKGLCGQQFDKDIQLSSECLDGPLILSASSSPVTVDDVPAYRVTFDMLVSVYESYEVGKMEGVLPLAEIKSDVSVTVVPDFTPGNEGGWLVFGGTFDGYEVGVF